MKKTNLWILIVTASVLSVISGCGGGGGNNSDPNRGFDLLPNRIEVSQTTGSVVHRPTMMRVISTFLEPQGTIRGTTEFFPARDIGPAATQFPGAKVPARWRFQYIEIGQIGRPPCQDGIRTVERNVGVGALERLDCTALVFPISVVPSAIDANSPPATIEIHAKGLSNDHGAPQVAILDEFGRLRGVVPATITNLEKGMAQINTPNVGTYFNGVYQITLSNVRANGSLDVIGVGELTIYGNEPPDPPDFPDPCLIPEPCLY